MREREESLIKHRALKKEAGKSIMMDNIYTVKQKTHLQYQKAEHFSFLSAVSLF